MGYLFLFAHGLEECLDPCPQLTNAAQGVFSVHLQEGYPRLFEVLPRHEVLDQPLVAKHKSRAYDAVYIELTAHVHDKPGRCRLLSEQTGA